jgi:catechol 2,3-dioxygenase-like lactoylglutathione lyase family enzyme
MATLGYCTVGSNSLEKAKIFYDALLGVAGMTSLFEHPSGGRVYGQDGNACFVVLGPYNGKAASVGTDEGAPGARRPDMHFSYFRDLDGNKLCAYCIG